MFMKFLVGLDGSNASRAALETGCKYARAFGAQVVAFVSVEGDVMTRDLDIEKANASLKFAAQYLKENGVEAQTQLSVRGFHPGEDIVNYAVEENIDGIFIGAQRRSKVNKMIFGSNALFIIQNAPCPVTTVN